MRAQLTFLVIFLSLIHLPAQAMRCNGKLIVPGDGMQKVRELCGDPGNISFYDIYNEQPVYYNHVHDDYCHHPEYIRIPTTIEVWTYDMGVGQFTRELHFKANRIMDIKRRR